MRAAQYADMAASASENKSSQKKQAAQKRHDATKGGRKQLQCKARAFIRLNAAIW
jgi:hypothetical protein